jgi:copper homeostasis protein
MQLEIAVSTIEAAILAEKAGAHRIELCDNLGEGGTTPSYGAIAYAAENIGIPVYPIIRPRGGDFLYTNAEMQVIKKDVQICKDLGCMGVVIGMLDANGNVDVKSLKEVIAVAGNMQITFHRAFDRCKDATIALEQLIDNGVHTILTSGQKANALEGATLIADLIAKAKNRITIMPGAGVRANILQQLIAATGAKFYHSSAGAMASSAMQYFNKSIDNNPPLYLHTNALEIAAMLKILNP